MLGPGATSTVRTWRFDGFERPVDDGGVLNVVKAGQAVPLKWRVLDAAGRPVTTIATARVTAQPYACGTGTTPDQPQESATGNSGLRHLGNGAYQFNWATP